MARSRVWLAFGALGLLALGTGCATCSHSAFADCLRPVEQVAVIAPARARVFVFLMNGTDVTETNHLDELHDRIIDAGFPKVYYAQRFDRRWFYEEVHRLRRDDPDNRFVLACYGTGAVQTQEVAAKVTADGIPLDAVLFLDPLGATGDLTQAPYHSLVLHSKRWPESPRLRPNDTLPIQQVGHLHLPDYPTALASVVEVLTASALRVPVGVPPILCVPQSGEPKAVPRPDEPKRVPPAPPEWEFLCPKLHVH